MLLKDLVNLPEEELKGSIHGVVVDEYVSKTVWSLDEIGFVVQYNDDKSYLSDDLLDVILDYQHTEVDVMIEIPFDSSNDIQMLHYCANTTHASLSLIPPKNGSEDDFETYKKQLVELTGLWLESNNTEYMLYPSSGYFHYMVRTAFGGTVENISDDPYMVEHFVDTMTIEKMDDIKDDLRVVFIEHIGGEDAFIQYVNSVAAGIAEQAADYADEIIKRSKEAEEAENDAKEQDKPE